MTTNNSIIFRAEYQEMLDGLRKIEPAWSSNFNSWSMGMWNYLWR